MKYLLPKLPFSKDALEPYLSAQAIDYHHGKHHQKYIDNLNALIEGSKYANMSLDEIIRTAPPGPLLNNAAQAWNHDFYWKSLTPFSRGPQGDLRHAIERQYGAQNRLEREICQIAAGQFGSGWAWLIYHGNGTLAVETTSNADTPLRHGKTPLLAIDVSEDAYSIDYRNERPRYLENLKPLLNWEFAEFNLHTHRAER